MLAAEQADIRFTILAQSEFMRVIESSFAVQTPEQFIRWTEEEIPRLLPHGILICGIGKIGRQSVQIHRYLFKRFPLDYLETLRNAGKGLISPVMARWCREGKPQLFEADAAGPEVAPEWLETFRKYGLRNIAAHGVRDMSGAMASYFSFSDIPEKLTARHAYLLELLVPHMHVALMRAFRNSEPALPRAQACGGVTLREREVLGWLREGKTNWEISRIFGVSENTVKNQVRSVLIKLKVNNRTQAVARAVAKKIL